MTLARYAFIKAAWHADIVDQALKGFVEVIPADQVDVFDVPGAFEMPLLARDLAATGRYAAVAAAAFVVDGGIYRHDFVAQAVVDGLMRAGLDTGIPVLSISLTPHHYREASPHADIFRAHFVTKGARSRRSRADDPADARAPQRLTSAVNRVVLRLVEGPTPDRARRSFGSFAIVAGSGRE